MRVTFRLFASLREKAGWDRRELDLPAGATAGDARRVLSELLPEAAPLLASSAIAINQQFATADRPLDEGDEIAVLPPVSGG